MTNSKTDCNCNLQNKKARCTCNTSRRQMDCDCNIIHTEVVKQAKSNMPDEEILLSMADFYKAMADSTRIKILSALRGMEMCVCDIASLLNMTKSAVSHQLLNLKEMDLVKSRRQGKEMWYSLADEHVEQVFKISYEHVLEAINEG